VRRGRRLIKPIATSAPTAARASSTTRKSRPTTTHPKRRFGPSRSAEKNFLFVGREEAGENIAGLYSLVATCEANSVNPYEYLRDVLLRVSTHPAARIDELLPDQWKPVQAT